MKYAKNYGITLNRSLSLLLLHWRSGYRSYKRKIKILPKTNDIIIPKYTRL